MVRNIIKYILQKLGIEENEIKESSTDLKPENIPTHVYMFDICRIGPRCDGVTAVLYLPEIKRRGFAGLSKSTLSSTAVLTEIVENRICDKHGIEYMDIPCLRICFCKKCIDEARKRPDQIKGTRWI